MKNTYPDWLVPTKIAIKLKKMGFDEPCICYQNLTYKKADSTKDLSKIYNSNINFKCVKNSEHINDDITFGVSIPTWEQVFKWFRDKGFMITLINHKNKSKFDFYNEKINNGTHCTRVFKTYEEARTGVVTELIKIYKENI